MLHARGCSLIIAHQRYFDETLASRRDLALEGVLVDSISADQAPAARSAVVDRFREGRIHLLVCTDLMARGIDFLNVQTVINYDFPLSAVDYVHR